MTGPISGRLSVKKAEGCFPAVTFFVAMHVNPRARQQSSAIITTSRPSSLEVGLRQTFSSLAYHAETLVLFTLSDFKTVVVPSAVFGVANGLAAGSYSIDVRLSPSQAVLHGLLALLWAWMNLLPFAIDNQRRPEAIMEDAVNKPWRAMPTRRLHPQSAKRAMVFFYAVVILASRFVLGGGLPQCLTLIILGFCYNELGGADAGFVVRNLINACGFVCYTSGAMDVVLQGALTRAFAARLASPLAAAGQTTVRWFGLVALIVFTTVQSQDFYDQPGDRLRGRLTMPLVLGDQPARIITTTLVAVFSAIAPSFWQVGFVGASMSLLLGGLVAIRTICLRSVPADKTTFRLWNLWLVAIYMLPLVKAVHLP